MRFLSLAVVFLCVFSAADAEAVAIEMVPVGNAGNAPDQDFGDGGPFGAVSYDYRIGKCDVTNNQYVEFLNAKDPSGANPLGLYNLSMSDATYGGINYDPGKSDGGKYSIVSSNGNHPVNYVTWYDAIRFANWLNNGGLSTSDTENGSYTLLHEGSPSPTPIPSNADSITRTATAHVVLPSENEWYKAAYYNPGTSSYFKYPTSSDNPPTAASPNALPNSANYDQQSGGPDNLTDVGAYSGTTSPYGAYDMGGNVWQWSEGFVDSNGPNRVYRGGSLYVIPYYLQSSTRYDTFPHNEGYSLGFRVALVPEPSTLALGPLGFAAVAVAARRKRR